MDLYYNVALLVFGSPSLGWRISFGMAYYVTSRTGRAYRRVRRAGREFMMWASPSYRLANEKFWTEVLELAEK